MFCFFDSRGSFFLSHTADIEFQWEPTYWGVKYTGCEKFSIFDGIHHFLGNGKSVLRISPLIPLVVMDDYRKS